MGFIISMAQALESLRFTRLKKGKTYRATKVILLDAPLRDTGPDVALLQLDNGQWTVLGSRHAPNGNWAVMNYGIETRDKAVLKALVQSGAIPQMDMDDHLARIDGARKSRSRATALQTLAATCEELGIPTPEVPA